MNRDLKFEYGFKSVNGIIKRVYHLYEIPNIKEKCDLWNELPIVYVRPSTGIKDRNGVEIFEGDIMQHANPFDIPFIVNWIDSECGYGFNYGSTSYVITDTSFTVIGNVFENPELLDVGS